MPADQGRIVKAPGRWLLGAREVGQVLVKQRQLPAGLAGGLGRAVVPRAGHESEELVDVIVQAQGRGLFVRRRQQGRDGKRPARQMLLDRMGEGDPLEVVPAPGPAFQQEDALIGRDNHLRGPAVPRRQRLDPVHDPDVVMAQDANQLLRRKIGSTSGHTRSISARPDRGRIVYVARMAKCRDGPWTASCSQTPAWQDDDQDRREGDGAEDQQVEAVAGDDLVGVLRLLHLDGVAVFELLEHRDVEAFVGLERRVALAEGLQVHQQLLDVVVAVLAVLGHHDLDDLGDAGREGRVDVVGRDELLVEVLVHDGGGVVAGEGHPAGDHVVEGGAEAVDVGPAVDVDLAADLLGGDVVRRAVGLALLALGGLDIGRLAGQTHIGQLHDALRVDHDVLGLDVAVDQAVGVGVLEGVADLDDDLEGLLLAENLAVGEVVGDGLALDVLHDEVVVAARLADVDGLDDVGVVELAGGLAFLVEPLDVLRVLGETLGQDLDRDGAVEAELLGLVDDGHRAGAELAEDLVAGNLRGGDLALLDARLESLRLARP